MTAIDTDNCSSYYRSNPNTVELSGVPIDVGSPSTEGEIENQWQEYLQQLAIAGFKQWLEEGALPLPGNPVMLKTTDVSTNLPSVNFQVGNYRLCIVALGSLITPTIEVAASSLSAEKNIDSEIAHLYVLVDVQEDLNQVSIIAGLTQAQLIQNIGRELSRLGKSLQIPLSDFDIFPEELLLYLSCLEPVPQPAANAVSHSVPAQSINAAHWIQDRLDDISDQLAWSLMPPLVTAMRPVKSSIANVVETLAKQDVHLPLQAKGVVAPIEIGPYLFQMYTWVWPIDDSAKTWTLFLVLGPQNGEAMPDGVQLQVSDQTVILNQQRLTGSSREAHLFTQVQGGEQEQFSVCIRLQDGTEKVLPPFSFEVEVNF